MNYFLRKRKERECKRCFSKNIIIDNGEYVCRTCGMVCCPSMEGEDTLGYNIGFNYQRYKRMFYFNERCARWMLCEPFIPKDIMDLIKIEANKDPWKSYISSGRCSRKIICRLLRSIKLPEELCEKYKSKKNGALLTQKRFADIYGERWKKIAGILTHTPPIIPSHGLVQKVKDIFNSCQYPFDMYLKHSTKCDTLPGCSKRCGCNHNFPNYDYFIRFFLQVAEMKHGYRNAFNLFKNEFPLVSDRIVQQKLRPLRNKICLFNEWNTIINDLED